MSDKKGLRYVVEHGGIGEWKRGDVLSDEQLLGKGCDINRLLSLRAMRPATELEYDQVHVDLPSEENNRSYQHLLAEKDMEIARLRQRLSEIEEDKALKSQLVVAQVHQSQAEVFKEKDGVITNLKAQAQQANETITKLQQQIREAAAGNEAGKRGPGRPPNQPQPA